MPSAEHGGGGGGGDLGLKVVSVRPANADAGLPTVPATVLLVDEMTGMPSALMDATFLTVRLSWAGGASEGDLTRSNRSPSLPRTELASHGK